MDTLVVYNKFNKALEEEENEGRTTCYSELAAVVSNILIEEYGSHNYKPFLEELLKHLNNDMLSKLTDKE